MTRALLLAALLLQASLVFAQDHVQICRNMGLQTCQDRHNMCDQTCQSKAGLNPNVNPPPAYVECRKRCVEEKKTCDGKVAGNCGK